MVLQFYPHVGLPVYDCLRRGRKRDILFLLRALFLDCCIYLRLGPRNQGSAYRVLRGVVLWQDAACGLASRKALSTERYSTSS